MNVGKAWKQAPPIFAIFPPAFKKCAAKLQKKGRGLENIEYSKCGNYVGPVERKLEEELEKNKEVVDKKTRDLNGNSR